MSLTEIPNSPLETTDPDIFAAVRAEEHRQIETLEMIASENFSSAAVREASGVKT